MLAHILTLIYIHHNFFSLNGDIHKQISLKSNLKFNVNSFRFVFYAYHTPDIKTTFFSTWETHQWNFAILYSTSPWAWEDLPSSSACLSFFFLTNLSFYHRYLSPPCLGLFLYILIFRDYCEWKCIYKLFLSMFADT